MVSYVGGCQAVAQTKKQMRLDDGMVGWDRNKSLPIELPLVIARGA